MREIIIEGQYRRRQQIECVGGRHDVRRELRHVIRNEMGVVLTRTKHRMVEHEAQIGDVRGHTAHHVLFERRR